MGGRPGTGLAVGVPWPRPWHSGRRGRAAGVAAGGAAAFAVLAFPINGFAPLVGAIEWMKYLSAFYYYAGNEPLANGVDLGNVAVLAGVTLGVVGIAVWGIRRRDLRA